MRLELREYSIALIAQDIQDKTYLVSLAKKSTKKLQKHLLFIAKNQNKSYEASADDFMICGEKDWIEDVDDIESLEIYTYEQS